MENTMTCKQCFSVYIDFKNNILGSSPLKANTETVLVSIKNE